VLIKLSCPNCGGTLELTSRPDLFKCAYCGQLSVLQWPATGAPSIARLQGKKTWIANFLRPGETFNWQGGKLHLTERELAFVPHRLNAGPHDRAVVPLAAITDFTLETGLIVDEVSLVDHLGEKWGLRVYDGKGLRYELQSSRY
jgi:hypothetical protein